VTPPAGGLTASSALRVHGHSLSDRNAPMLRATTMSPEDSQGVHATIVLHQVSRPAGTGPAE
jgi:hypothetical protein